MALFPPEMIGCVIASFLVMRLKNFISLANASLNGLTFFLPPTDAVIEQLNVKKSKRAKIPLPEKTPQERMKNMVLEYSTIKHGLLDSTLFYEHYSNLMAVTSSAVLAFAWSELRHCVTGTGSQTISFYGLAAALLLTIFYPFHIQYRSGWMGSYETQICTAFGLLAMIIALFTIYAPPQVLDMDLDSAFKSIDERMQVVWAALAIDVGSKANMIYSIRDVWYVLLGLLAGSVTALYVVPGIRFAKVYTKLVQATDVSWFKKILLHCNVIFPAIVVICWIKPLSELLLIRPDAIHCTADQTLERDCILNEAGEIVPDPSWIVHSQWRSLRLYFVLLTVLIRVLCMKMQLQVFLFEPKDSIIRELHRKGPVDGDVLKDKVRSHFNFLPVVAMQYVTPLLLPFLLCLAMKRKAGTSMGICHGLKHHIAPTLNASWFDPANMPMAAATNLPGKLEFFPFGNTTASEALNMTEMELTSENVLGIFHGINSYPLVTPEAYDSLMGFLMLWSNLSWFVLSLLSILYWRNNPTAPPTIQSNAAVEQPKSKGNKKKKSKQL